MDLRPICNCSAYWFPHKVGGKCDGSAFTRNYFFSSGDACDSCNCKGDDGCEVVSGQESISEADCYEDFCRDSPSEHLPLEPNYPEED